MIGKIKGKLTEIHGNEALIETKSDVSYKVFVGPNVYGKKGTVVDLYTYLVVKEDELSLYGFSNYEEHILFTLLTSVDGVGPKIAFTIVHSSDYGAIQKAIREKDVQFFQKIKGIGKKTAQKILLELSTKMGAVFELSDVEESQEDRDTVDALVALGFKKEAVQKVLKEIDHKLPLEEKIKIALAKL